MSDKTGSACRSVLQGGVRLGSPVFASEQEDCVKAREERQSLAFQSTFLGATRSKKSPIKQVQDRAFAYVVRVMMLRV